MSNKVELTTAVLGQGCLDGKHKGAILGENISLSTFLFMEEGSSLRGESKNGGGWVENGAEDEILQLLDHPDVVVTILCPSFIFILA